MKPRFPVRGLALLGVAVAVGCSQGAENHDNSPTGGGQGGNAPSNPGGGSGGNGGQHSGTAGTAGTASSGGNASGGNGGSTGGASGGNDAGGSAGQPDGGEGGNAGEPNDPGGGGMNGASLDECFDGLRDGTGRYQVATKVDMAGDYRFRLALETADRFGTSGTVPWLPYRFAIETPTASVCVMDETELAAAYTGSHHNCEDAFSWTDGALRYEIEHADTAVDRPSSLIIYEGQAVVAGPIRLDLETCHSSNGPNDECGSGGPCDIQITPF